MEPDHGEWGGVVDRPFRQAVAPADTCYRGDHGPGPRAQERDGGVHAVQHPREIGLYGLPPLLRFAVGTWGMEVHAGSVGEKIEAMKAPLRLGKERRYLLGITGVGCYRIDTFL